MRILLFIYLVFGISGIFSAQIVYESPIGFTVSFDKTWKRLPREVLKQRIDSVKELLEYGKDLKFDVCYQKVGKADMEFPYILFENVYHTTNDLEEIEKVRKYWTNKDQFNAALEELVDGEFETEIEIGKSYYDTLNKVLVVTYEMDMSVSDFNGYSYVSMIAYYFGKEASLVCYCYSAKEDFKKDQKEFLSIVYSIRDNGIRSTMDDYLKSHDQAVNYFNEAKVRSSEGLRNQAIELYTKAIESYPLEDSFLKAEAYYNRGLNKRYLEDNEGAILDYTEAIKLRPDYSKAFNNRGFARIQMDDYEGAISDFTSAIKFDNYNTAQTSMAYGNRGIAKLLIGLDGCTDLKKAIELGNVDFEDMYNLSCN